MARTPSKSFALALGLCGFFLSLVGGAALHLRTAAVRKALRTTTVQFLNSTLRGHFAIRELSAFTSRGLLIRGVRIDDPSGRLVLSVPELTADFDLIGTALRMVRGNESRSLVVEALELDHPELFLYDSSASPTESTELSIASAFEPRVPSTGPEKPSALRFWFPEIRVKELEATAEMRRVPRSKLSANLAGQLLVSQRGVAIDLGSFQAKVRGPLSEAIQVEGNGKLRVPGALNLTLHYQTLGADGREHFQYDAGQVHADGTARGVSPGLMRELWPDWPLDRTVDLVHSVDGLLPRLKATVELRSGGGLLKAAGRLRVSPELEADLDVDAENLSLNALRSDLPETTLDFRSALEVWSAEGAPVLSWNATVLPGLIAELENPAVDSAGTYDERGLQGTLTVHERGLPLHIAFKKKDAQGASFDARLKRTRLEQAPRIQKYIAARGQIEGTLAGTWDGKRVVLLPSIAGRALGYGKFGAESVALAGRVTTPLDELAHSDVDLKLKAQGVAIGSFGLENLEARVIGPSEAPVVSLDAQTRRKLDLHLKAKTRTDRLEIADLRGEVRGDGRPIVIVAEHLSSQDQVHKIEGLLIESTGRLTASARLAPGSLQMDLDGQRLDLGRIGRILELAPGAMEGHLDIHSHGQLSSDSDLRFDAHVDSGSAFGILDTTLNAKGSFRGHRLESEVDLAVAHLGRASARTQLELGGSPLSLDSFQRGQGQAEISLDDVDLPFVSQSLTSLDPISLDSGKAQVRIAFEKPSERPIPTAHLDARTEGLSMSGLPNGTELRGIDAKLMMNLDPELNRMDGAVRLEDVLGDLLSVSGAIDLPLATWNQKLPDLLEVTRALYSGRLAAVLALPRRDLADIPVLGSSRESLRGTAEARGILSGSLNEPLLDGSFELTKLRADAMDLSEAIGVMGKLRYEPNIERLSGQVSAQGRAAQVAVGSFDVRYLGGEAETAWTGEAQLQLDDAPLDLIAHLKRQKIRGLAQGAIAIRRSEKQTVVDADVRLRQLAAFGEPLGSGQVHATTKDDQLTIESRLDDAFGSLSVNAEGKVRPTRWAIEPYPGAPLKVSLVADRYDAAVLGPAFSGVLSQLSGALNGKLEAEFRIPEGEEEELGARLRGRMRMTDGSIVPASMGLRLEDVELDISAEPEGAYNVIRLSDIRAKARSSVHNLKGKGVLYFRGLNLSQGQLNLSERDVPVLSEGVKLADLTGQLSMRLKKTDTELRVDLDVPELVATLPVSSDHSLIELKENETISVLGPRRMRQVQEKERGERDIPVIVQVHLGPRVRLKSSIASIRLEGEPTVRLDEKMSVQGQVVLAQGGRIEVLGKVFIVDHGAVFFDSEDVTNPLIDTTATWRAPSGVLIRATLTGRAQNPSLAWSSDPPIAGGESAIVALVLGASGNGSAGTSGLAYGAAALNQLLGESGVRGLGITAGRESQAEGQVARLSDRGWNSYAATVQVSDEIWFEGKYTRETNGPVQRSGFSGTIDWRFHPSWSARSEVGTLGLGADLLWQYRY